MRLNFSAADLAAPQGLEIGVIGFRSNPTDHESFPAQIYIEVHEEKLRVCIWNGDSENPSAIHEIQPLKP